MGQVTTVTTMCPVEVARTSASLLNWTVHNEVVRLGLKLHLLDTNVVRQVMLKTTVPRRGIVA